MEEGNKGILYDSKNVLYFDLSSGYLEVYIYIFLIKLYAKG